MSLKSVTAVFTLSTISMTRRISKIISQPKMSIGSHIILRIIFSILIPFIILLGSLIALAEPYIKQRLTTQHTVLAHAVTEQSSNYLKDAAGKIRLLASLLADGQVNRDEEINRLLDLAITETQTISTLMLTDTTGKITHIGLAPAKRNLRRNFLGVDISRHSHIAQARRHRAEHWSDVFLSAIGGGVTVALAVPIGERMLVGEIPLAKLANNVHTLSNSHQLVMLFDSRGQLIAHPDHDKGAQQINLRAIPMINNTINSQSNTTDTFIMDDREYLGTASKLSNIGWYAMVAAPVTVIYEPIAYLGWALLGGIIIAILTTIGLALISARHTADAVAGFSHAARRIANGDYSVNLPGTNISELGELGDHLSSMARAIETRESDIRNSERQFRAFYDAGLVGLALIDIDGHWLRLNDALLQVLNYTPDDLLGASIMAVTHNEDLPQLEENFSAMKSGAENGFELVIRMTRKDGHIRWTQTVARMVHKDNGQPDYVALMVRDITSQKEAEEQIEQLAFYDPLTGLPNRRLFHDRLGHAMTLSARTNSYGAVLFLDLDRFKELNDTAGHGVGDLLLVQVARRLQSRLREADTVARLGGDEYIILLEELGDDLHQAMHHCETTASQLKSTFEQLFILDGREYHSTFSMGICMFRGHEISADEVLKRADSAMYQAKNHGRSMMRFYDPKLQSELEERAYIVGELRRAVATESLQLYLQPIVDRQQELLGAEVLLRWEHPHRGFIPPGEFIPLAEDSGLIEAIGKWVLEQACEILSYWRQDARLAHLYLSINVSPRQFRRRNFVSEVKSVVSTFGIPANKIMLELTETVLLDDLQVTRQKMNVLKELGIGFSLDDFGTGYSSLDYLKRLPFDQLKIDRSFVCDIGRDSTATKIVNATLAMGQLLDINMVAEGVETRQQFEFLAAHDCQKYQGYLFGKPIPSGLFPANREADETVINFGDYTRDNNSA